MRPETLIGNSPDFFVRHTLKDWAASGFVFDRANIDDYLASFRDPASIHASCEDYRAGWTVDRAADEADLGKRKIGAPLHVLWGRDYAVAKARPVETWQRWADSVVGAEVPGGHFQCEEAPTETIAALTRFFAG